MDSPDSPGGGSGSRPPRKELQGPRPTPLKVRKDSHKIRKPPMAPGGGPPQNYQLPPQPPPRQPVIIYTVSPKVIHTNPNDFMNLVQRLTGPDHATSSSASSSSSSYSITQYSPFNDTSSSTIYHVPSFITSSTTTHNMAHHVSGAISPAARLASIEMTKMHQEPKKYVDPSEFMQEVVDVDVDHGTSGGGSGGGGGTSGGTMFFPGILSPGPCSLPPISPNLFSPLFHDPTSNINMQHHDLNVVQHGNRRFIEGSYIPSPNPFSTNFVSPTSTMFSPASLDFLQRVLDS